MTTPELAVVTGGNRGLGLETCRQLAERGLRVVLASRDTARGEQAAGELRRLGHDVRAMHLDVTDPDSVAQLSAELAGGAGRIGVLVNNAGVSLKGFNADVARRTMAVNFFGAESVTDQLTPLLERGARVVMVSSGLGSLDALSESLQRELTDPLLSRDRLNTLMRGFVEDVAAGRHRERGWPNSAYAVSKVGINALTRVVAREFGSAGPRVNAVRPGWVRTDMGGPSASRSVAEGARGIVWAALVAPDGPTGGLFRDGQPSDW